MAKRRSRSRRASKAEQEFLSEGEEILERMRVDLLDLAVSTEGVDGDPELVNRLFRSAHSLKGLAGLFGLDPIHDLAHHLEDVLDNLRLGRLTQLAPVLAVLDASVARFSALLEAMGDAEALAVAAEPVAELVREIEAVQHGGSAPQTEEFGELDLDPRLLRALTEYEEHRLRENLRRGHSILLIEAGFEMAAFEEGLSALTAAAREAGEVLSTLPSPSDAVEAEIRFSLLVASDSSAEEVAARLALPGATVRGVGTRAVQRAETPEATPAGRSEPVHPTPDLESLQSISDTVRVDIRKLDELMNLVGEIVIQRAALGELIGGLAGRPETGRLARELAAVHKGLDRKLRELQAAVLDVRMVPLRQVFEKVSRVVRRLKSELEKEVRLELRGADTELDKLIVEELVDPLMHIVRNALDHAIETPQERVAAGKDPRGLLRIEAFQRGNHVVIAVSDDGRGVDRVALRAKGEALGLVAHGATLSDKEVLELLFAPGVSTREEVTETSGRGVGMDVVRHNLTSLGGVVDVESTPGRGTSVSMTLPITLAIIRSLVVAVGDQRFAVPLSSVHETLLVEPGEIQRSEGRELLNLRGDALPLRRLREEFGLAPAGPDSRHFAVVLGMGDSRVGLLVDRLEGQEDTVIKPIQGPIQTVRGIAGATELGGTEPVLVLDVSAFLNEARLEAA